ncbi:Dendrite extension defective 1 [Paramuricea clavata]|uniref:Dendrite extension defective 1 n=1 Tax=Paramuricea clavata TaxID=317549 RepID=A0A6S7I1B7_PARCT|nr:Dendrite extension defective 1 [Paramuricea clavata]
MTKVSHITKVCARFVPVLALYIHDSKILSHLDINECVQTSKVCHAQANCSNIPGSFSCQCSSGFEGDGIQDCTGQNILKERETFLFLEKHSLP